MQVSLKIYGKVQGVFYRKSAKEEASRLGIGGWVRNVSGGSVEALAVGPEDKLKKFVEWCKKGPPFATVEKVEEDWQEDGEDFGSFEILG